MGWTRGGGGGGVGVGGRGGGGQTGGSSAAPVPNCCFRMRMQKRGHFINHLITSLAG